MNVHILKASEGGSHQQHPALDAVTNPVLDARFFAPLALLDLGFVDPEWAGRKVLCLAMSVGAVDEDLVIRETDDGRWTLSKIDGATPEDPTRGSKWAEGFEEGPGAFDRLPSFEAAELVEVAQGDFERSQHVWMTIGEPRWVQSPEPPGDGWRFVAQLESYYLFGTVFVFYNPETREAYHMLQFT